MRSSALDRSSDTGSPTAGRRRCGIVCKSGQDDHLRTGTGSSPGRAGDHGGSIVVRPHGRKPFAASRGQLVGAPGRLMVPGPSLPNGAVEGENFAGRTVRPAPKLVLMSRPESCGRIMRVAPVRPARGQRDHVQSGDVYNAYAVRLASSCKVVGVSERAGLRNLRQVRISSRVFIRPTTVKELENGRRMQQFEIFAEHLEPLTEPGRGVGGRVSASPSDATSSVSENIPF